MTDTTEPQDPKVPEIAVWRPSPAPSTQPAPPGAWPDPSPASEPGPAATEPDEADRLRDQVASEQARVEELSEKLAAADASTAEATARLEAAQSELEDMAARLEAAANTDHQRQVAKLEERVSALVTEAQNLRVRNRELEAVGAQRLDPAAVGAHIESQTQTVQADATNRIESIQVDADRRVNEAESQLAEAQRELSAADARVNVATSSAAAARDALTTANGRAAALASQLDSAKADQHKAEELAADLRSRLQAAATKSDRATARITELENLLGARAEEVADLEERVARSDELAKSFALERQALTADRDAAIEQLQTSTASLVEVTKTIHEERAQHQARVDEAFEAGSRLAERAAARVAELEAMLESDG